MSVSGQRILQLGPGLWRPESLRTLFCGAGKDWNEIGSDQVILVLLEELDRLVFKLRSREKIEDPFLVECPIAVSEEGKRE